MFVGYIPKHYFHISFIAVLLLHDAGDILWVEEVCILVGIKR